MKTAATLWRHLGRHPLRWSAWAQRGRSGASGQERLGNQIAAIDGAEVRVRNLEVLDGTPIVDVTPLLDPTTER